MGSNKDKLPPVDEKLLKDIHDRAVAEEAKKPSLSIRAIRKIGRAFGLNPRP